MDKINLKARAKINLSLDIRNKREDNYHNIVSVFQKVSLYDELYIEKNNTNKFQLETNIESLNNNENIIYKAYLALKERYDNITGINVKLNKLIPMQAGLGGGSTDCASFILGINKLFDLKLSKSEIESIGKSLGADVVPCFYNQAILAEGIGDIITPINTDFEYYVVIIKPSIFCNTKEMYHLIDQRKEIPNQDSSNIIIKGLQENNVELIAKNLYNAFEDVLLEKELIQNIKEEFKKNGALGASLTGSGSCVFGIFGDKQLAQKAFEKLKLDYQAYLCTSYNKSEDYSQ